MHDDHASNTELSFVRKPVTPYVVSARPERMTDVFAKLFYVEDVGE